MKMIEVLRRIESMEVAKERLEIIEVKEKQGEEVRKEAYGGEREEIRRWGRRYMEGGKRLRRLVAYSS